MTMQSGSSPLKGKMKGLSGAAAASRGKPIEIGKSRLPAGIDGGVARLSQCGLGAYEPDHKSTEFRNKPYFSAMGVVALPAEHEGKPTRGLQTWLQRIPLFDTPKAVGKYKTLADHFNRMRSHLTALGFDVDAINLPPDAPDDVVLAAIEAGCKSLEQAKPHFRFRTWQGKKDEIVERAGKWFVVRRGGELGPYASKEALLKINKYADSEPMVNEQWEGACEYSENGEAASAVEDNTVEVADEPAVGAKDTEFVEENAEGGDEVATEEAVDLDAIAVLANKKNDAAERQLLAIATEMGLAAEADVADNWRDVVALIRAAQESGEAAEVGAPLEEGEEDAAEDEAAADDVPFVPAVGIVYRWPAGKPKKEQREIVVTKVSTKNETVLANSNTTKKPLLGAKDKKPLAIKWTALEPM